MKSSFLNICRKHEWQIKHGIQLLGVILLGVGVGIELACHAAVGYAVITFGSAVFAFGTKLVHERRDEK